MSSRRSSLLFMLLTVGRFSIVIGWVAPPAPRRRVSVCARSNESASGDPQPPFAHRLTFLSRKSMRLRLVRRTEPPRFAFQSVASSACPSPFASTVRQRFNIWAGSCFVSGY